MPADAAGSRAETESRHIEPSRSPSSSLNDETFAYRWRRLRTVGGLFGLMLGTSFLVGLAARGSASPWIEATGAGIDFLIVAGYVVKRYALVRPLLHPEPRDPATNRHLVAVAILFVVLMAGYFALLDHWGVPLIPIADHLRRAGWSVPSMLLFVSIAPAITEELAFRGIVQGALEEALGAREAWLIQGALFSVLHLSPLMFPSHFVMGLTLGYLRQRSMSLYPGMLLHGTWNALVLFQDLRGV